MKVTVFGATGAIGKLVVENLLAQGHEVKAYVRSPSKAPAEWRGRVELIEGALSDSGRVTAAVRGADAVVSAVGTPIGKQPKGAPLTSGAQNIVAAMRSSGVRRYIGLATPTVKHPEDQRSFGQKLLFGLAARLFAEVVTMSAVISESDLDSTLVRFLDPSHAAAKGSVRAAYLGKGVTGKVTRADVARFVVDQLTDTTWIRGMPILSN